MRGRKPKPTHLKLVEGNPGKRKLNTNEPVPKAELSSPPAELTEEQRKIWDFMVENSPRGMLKAIDRDLLAAYVVAVDLHRQATKRLAHTPLIVKSPGGVSIQSPYVRIQNAQSRLIISLGSELGFSPVARTRISLEPDDLEDDPAERYFR